MNTGRSESSYKYVGTSGRSFTAVGKLRSVLAIPLYDNSIAYYGGLVFRVMSLRPRRLLWSQMHPQEKVWGMQEIEQAAHKFLEKVEEDALTEGVDLDIELMKDYR